MSLPQSPFLSADPPLTAETAPTEIGWNPVPVGADNKQRLLVEDDYRFVLNEEKFLFDIGCVPDDFAKYMAMLDELIDDPPPLFLRSTG